MHGVLGPVHRSVGDDKGFDFVVVFIITLGKPDTLKAEKGSQLIAFAACDKPVEIRCRFAIFFERKQSIFVRFMLFFSEKPVRRVRLASSSAGFFDYFPFLPVTEKVEFRAGHGLARRGVGHEIEPGIVQLFFDNNRVI